MITQAFDSPASREGYPGEDESSDLAILLLDSKATIVSCSPIAEHLFGYRHDELEGSHVSRVLPEFAEAELLPDGRLNPRVAFLCHCGRHFRAQRSDGTQFAGELHFVAVPTASGGTMRMLVRDAANARPLLA